ncbi:MAG: NDP-sugar synthase [SAR202 cluster bacterium]|nr:NDP-sugar synthase [SAR202 cluster bacterium]
MESLTAVVLVGGLGTRLRPLTSGLPKPMIPVLNRPFLEHLITKLKTHGVKRVILASGYQPDVIEDYFGGGLDLGVEISYAVEDSPLGTSGAVKASAGDIPGTFLVLNGDVVMDLDVTEFLERHKATSASATIALYRVDDPSPYGVVPLDDDGRVQQFIEKPTGPKFPSHFINSGCYALEPSVLDFISEGEFTMFERDTFPALLSASLPVYGFPWDGYWRDIGTVSSYTELNRDILENRISSPFWRVPTTIAVGDDSLIHPTAELTGPVLIGDRCIVGAGTRIIGPTILGDDCSIGARSEIRKSIIWRGTRVGMGVDVQGSVVGMNVSIGDGAHLEDGCVLATDVKISDGHSLQTGTVIDHSGHSM